MEVKESIEQRVSIMVEPLQDKAVFALLEEAGKIQQYAESVEIKVAEDVKLVTNDLSFIAGLKRQITEKRKEYLNPLLNHVEDVRQAFKQLLDPLTAADDTIKKKILAYNAEVAQERQKQEEINRLRMEAAKKEMELKGELTESVDLVEVTPEAKKTVSTDMGTAGQRDNWKYEVVDFALLPDEYKVADSSMLNTVAKKHHDQKQVTGVRFYNEPIIAVRSRNQY